jgi:hypothetical protein
MGLLHALDRSPAGLHLMNGDVGAALSFRREEGPTA